MKKELIKVNQSISKQLQELIVQICLEFASCQLFLSAFSVGLGDDDFYACSTGWLRLSLLTFFFIDDILRVIAYFGFRLPYSQVFLRRTHPFTCFRPPEALPKGLLALRPAELSDVIVGKSFIKVRHGGIPRMALPCLVIRN
jgi:hypothetical protein